LSARQQAVNIVRHLRQIMTNTLVHACALNSSRAGIEEKLILFTAEILQSHAVVWDHTHCHLLLLRPRS
jgi:hypothetical protein